MNRFNLVALGGTFDIIHRGHVELFKKGFSISSKVIIGLTSDDLASKKGKTPKHDYAQRYKNLKNMIEENFPNSTYEIIKLENDFGPAVLEKEVEALVVSEETSSQGMELNRLRVGKKSPPVTVVIVPMVLACDGIRISSTRIKKSEIDPSGNILS